MYSISVPLVNKSKMYSTEGWFDNNKTLRASTFAQSPNSRSLIKHLNTNCTPHTHFFIPRSREKSSPLWHPLLSPPWQFFPPFSSDLWRLETWCLLVTTTDVRVGRSRSTNYEWSTNLSGERLGVFETLSFYDYVSVMMWVFSS